LKILIEWGGYQFGNMGDIAMLQVAVERINKIWKNPSIKIFTTHPDQLAIYVPNTCPLSTVGRNIYLSPLINRLRQSGLNDWSLSKWEAIEYNLRVHTPYLVDRLFDFKLRSKREQRDDLHSFLDAIAETDLVIVTGGGYITDEFKSDTTPRLDTLRLANKLGKPVVLFGQGLGPFNDKKFYNKVQAVLSQVQLIAVREQRIGVPLLESFKVSQDRIFVTGDDAIELAYNSRCSDLGGGIGVNLRIASYSRVGQDLLETIRECVQRAAISLSAFLVPIPIERTGFPESPDSEAIQKLLEGFDHNTDGGASLDTPLKVIQNVGLCRVVVTGSYHAGVFALAQGIPVIGLAKSEYYIDKFLGLADQFGAGCEVILLDDLQLKDKLFKAIIYLWKEAENLRPKLLKSSQLQISQGHSAYNRAYEIVNNYS